MEDVFVVRNEVINDRIDLTILEFPELTSDLITLLDQNLVAISEGAHSSSTLMGVKQRIIELFAGKELKKGDGYSNWEMGAVAEVFIHLYISTKGFKQECMFLNLEDRSAKKGFDGYYTDDDSHWIMESKSGSISTEGISHTTKLKEAVDDLQGKFDGTGTKNNPWREAYNHASHQDVGSADDIRSYIKNLADEFTSGSFHDVSEFNIIPCATLYYEDRPFESSDDITAGATGSVEGANFIRAHLVCVSSKSVQIFKDYLRIEA